MLSCCFFSQSKKSISTAQEAKKFNIDSDTVNQDKKRIGKGATSIVFRGQWEEKDIAIKQFNSYSHEYVQEKNIAKKLIGVGAHTNNIIQYYGCIENGGKFSLVMEYMSQGSLTKYFSKNQPDINTFLPIACGIARGLQCLHQQYKIIHCDIKPDNILINDLLQIKICDFGASMFRKHSKNSEHYLKGTTGYVAPELLKSYYAGHTYLPYSYRTDVYAFGVTLFELVHIESAYNRESNISGIDAGVMKGVRPTISDTCPKDIANIISSAWARKRDRAEVGKLVHALDTAHTTRQLQMKK